MDKLKQILILPGDGIGPEVCDEARKVLIHVNEVYNLGIIHKEAAVGGIAYDTFGKPLPDETLEAARDSDAILLGAVGGPAWDNLDYQQSIKFYFSFVRPRKPLCQFFRFHSCYIPWY